MTIMKPYYYCTADASRTKCNTVTKAMKIQADIGGDIAYVDDQGECDAGPMIRAAQRDDRAFRREVYGI